MLQFFRTLCFIVTKFCVECIHFVFIYVLCIYTFYWLSDEDTDLIYILINKN